MCREKTAELVAIAEGKAADADCAMVSLNEYHGNDNCNEQGVAWHIYKGNINTEHINIFRPRSAAISVLQLTGQEIREMQRAGFDQDENGNPYDYPVLVAPCRDSCIVYNDFAKAVESIHDVFFVCFCTIHRKFPPFLPKGV